MKLNINKIVFIATVCVAGKHHYICASIVKFICGVQYFKYASVCDVMFITLTPMTTKMSNIVTIKERN